MSLHIALYQPDIPGNTGTILRLGACLDIKVHIIEPAGFDLSSRALKRAGMDYLAQAALQRHEDWQKFCTTMREEKRRILLFTTRAAIPYTRFAFQSGDVLLFGRESAGVPENVHNLANAHLIIPMKETARSLNLAMSVAMAAGEAIRQTDL